MHWYIKQLERSGRHTGQQNITKMMLKTMLNNIQITKSKYLDLYDYLSLLLIQFRGNTHCFNGKEKKKKRIYMFHNSKCIITFQFFLPLIHVRFDQGETMVHNW